MLKKFLNIIVLLTFAFHLPAFADEVANLDEANIVVESRSSKLRQEALKEALASVFLKNSGKPSVVLHPLIKAQIDNPELLLIQYGYTQEDENLILKANFDHQGVIRTLRQADQPVWGVQRPLTLLWLSFVEDNSRVILSDISDNEIRDNLTSESSNKGIPILLPLMDLDDLMAVSPTDVKGMFVSPIKTASNRYKADYFAVADIEESLGRISYKLTLYNNNQTEMNIQPLFMRQGVAADTTAAANIMIALLADYYISQYAIESSGNDLTAHVSFTGVTSMAQVVDLEDYLKSLSAVKSVSVNALNDATITYKLSLFSSIEDLERLLNLDNRFTQIDAIGSVDMYYAPQGDQANKLNYQWQSQ
ncbi:DUF2066 domain-containing protein [Shewanella gaetbuli]